MRLLQEGLAAGGTAGPFQVVQAGPVYIEIVGTYDSETVTLQKSYDRVTFTPYYADGTVPEWGDTIEARKFDLPDGYYQLVASNGGGSVDVDVYVGGKFVRV